MIRTIFFDYDGVLTTDKNGSPTTFRYLSDASGIALSTISAAFGPYNGDLLMGRASHAQIWGKACEGLGQSLDNGLLAGAFESTPLNERMVRLAQRLKATRSVVIIMEHLRKHQGLDSLFNPIVVSADVGGTKRSQGIFPHALSRAAVAPNESIFIDNSEDNLVAARALGMHVVFHDEKNDIASLVRQLDLLGIRIDDH